MEEQSQASRTSLMTAYCRGYHAVNDAQKIFDDNLAYRFLTEEERASLEQTWVAALQAKNPEHFASFPDREAVLAWMVKAYFPSSLFLSRARYTEDSLEEAVNQGVQQYVILGAGLDTFAFRRPDLLEKIQVFEVDHPATQAFKRRRIAAAGLEPPENLHFVAVDFTKENLTTALARSAFDSQVHSFFSWLGVIHYLPRDAVFSTLRTIADLCPAGSMVVFDYYDLDAFNPEKAAKRVYAGIQWLRQTREPMITGLDPAALAEDLQRVGLRLQEQWGPADIQAQYFQGRTDGYYAYEHGHFAKAVVE